MARSRVCLFALVFAAAAHGAWAADDIWQLKAATGRLAFHPEVARDLGIEVQVNAPADPHGRLVTEFGAAGRLEMRASGTMFRDIGTGDLRLASTGALRLGATEVALQGLTVQRGTDERTLALVANDGRVLFFADHMHFEVDRTAGRIKFFNLDLRLAPEAARALGQERYTDTAVAVMEMEGPVAIPAAAEEPSGCATPNWGLPDNDTAMLNIGTVQQMAKEPPEPGVPAVLVALAPSATVKNVGVTDVPWYSKFSGNFPPYNNDQHPYLAWNIYRLAGGVLEQIGVSPLKHAFLTVNANCSCSNSHILGVGCEDTYGTGNNDSLFDLTLRHEITAFTGVWQRCGSIFDPDCNGVQNSPPPRANAMDRRMAVAVADLQTPGAVYYFDSWYVVRDDTNIFNQGWRTVNPVAPTPPGTTWTFPLTSPLTLGTVIEQWVNPANPGPNAQSVAINTVLGRLRLAVRVFDQGGGQWRYEYGLQNFDFDPRIRSFTVPLPPGAVVTNVGFHDPDQDAANNWTATVGATSITWQAPTEDATQDWDRLYNFRFTVNAVPTAPDGAVLSMKVHEAKVWKLGPTIIGPGTISTSSR